jgi:CO/xanthine dehydrogenase FAD-binding subunit
MPVFYRRLPKFHYVSPKTVEEVILFLAAHAGQAKLMAGGTDLIPGLKRREIASPAYVVDLKGLPGLSQLSYDPRKGLFIGALATIRAIGQSPLVREKYPSLIQAACSMASPQVRNRATFVGNICSALPSADSAPPLLTLQACVRLQGPKGERTLPLEQFFVGPRETAMEADEIVTALEVPVPPAQSVYLKLSPRHSMDLAIVGVAAAADVEDGRCRDIRIALGAVAPIPFRARKAEEVLHGRQVSPALIEETAQAASMECRPIDDFRASAAYRRDMAYILTRRALRQVFPLSGGGGE